MLHFLPMVTLCLYPFLFPKSPKSFIYNGHPSPVCWKEIPKNYNMTSRSSCSWILSAFPVDTASFVLLYTSGHSVRCRFVHFSIFFALFCWIIWVTLLVDFSLAAHKQPYFDRMGSCKLLSSLPTEFTPAHVSFTRFLVYIFRIHFLLQIFNFVSLLLELLSSYINLWRWANENPCSNKIGQGYLKYWGSTVDQQQV